MVFSVQTSDWTKYFGELYSCRGGRCIASEMWLSQGPHTSQLSRCWEYDSCPVLKQKRTNPSCRSLRKSKNTKLSCVIHGGYLWTWGSLWMDNSINILPESYLAEQRIRNLGRVWSAETGRNKIGVCWLDIKKNTFNYHHHQASLRTVDRQSQNSPHHHHLPVQSFIFRGLTSKLSSSMLLSSHGLALSSSPHTYPS